MTDAIERMHYIYRSGGIQSYFCFQVLCARIGRCIFLIAGTASEYRFTTTMFLMTSERRYESIGYFFLYFGHLYGLYWRWGFSCHSIFCLVVNDIGQRSNAPKPVYTFTCRLRLCRELNRCCISNKWAGNFHAQHEYGYTGHIYPDMTYYSLYTYILCANVICVCVENRMTCAYLQSGTACILALFSFSAMMLS